LQIAAKIGLPEDVLEDAKASIGHDPVAFETLVNELEQEKRKYQEYNQRNQLLNKALEQEQAIYQSRSSKLEDRQKEILNQAKMEAQQLLTEANKRIEATIRSIKENKAQKAETQKARKQLEVFKDENKPKKVNKPVPTAIVPGPIKPGDMVRFKDSQAQGEVISITGGSAEILMGALKSKVRLERLQKIGKAAPNSKPGRSKIEIHQKREQFSTQLDVRGLRAAEALAKVDDFIDQGLLFGMSELQILHGKGDGILREVIRRHLREDQSVRSMQDAHVERGGAGITLVTLK